MCKAIYTKKMTVSARYQGLLILFLLLTLVFSCESPKFSPWQTNVPSHLKNSNARNLQKLRTRPSDYPVRIALIGDTHNYYKNFDAVVHNINQDNRVDFVIQVGDVTNYGLLEEYEWSYKIFSKIQAPFFVVVGNHDAISSGKDIYKKLFGDYNFSFVFGNIHFIFFNNNDVEYRQVDYRWLKRELEHNQGTLKKVVISHIPPWADRSFRSTQALEDILVNHGMVISLHGHTGRSYKHVTDAIFIGAGDVRSQRHGYLEFLNTNAAVYEESSMGMARERVHTINLL